MNWPEGVEKPEAVERYFRWLSHECPEDGCAEEGGSCEFGSCEGIFEQTLTACGQRIAELEREVERLNKLVKHAADTLLMLTECDGVDDD